jgi:hypothetical protein
MERVGFGGGKEREEGEEVVEDEVKVGERQFEVRGIFVLTCGRSTTLLAPTRN